MRSSTIFTMVRGRALVAILIGAISGTLLLCTGLLVWQLRQSLPDDIPVVLKTDVGNPVEVYLDHRGRPYVYAASFADALFAQGYLHARDRLWQMEMFRRAANGRLAEVIGNAGLETDIAMWRAGVPELAARMQANASKQLQRYVQAYVDGVNSYQDHPLPPEFFLVDFQPDAWQPKDVYAMAALMAQQSANNLSKELVRLALMQELGCHRARIFFPHPHSPICPANAKAKSLDLSQAHRHVTLLTAGLNPHLNAPVTGSNAWAVRATNGAALFAFDSHDGISLPNLTYDVHLFVGDRQIRGNSVAGLLGVINGFNEFMAWGFTNIGDSQDAYLETVDPNDPLRFHDGQAWYKAEVAQVAIPVRGAQPYLLDIITTRFGRLISHDPPIAVRWAPLEHPYPGLDALLKLNRASSYRAFNDALDEFIAPSAIATYADVTGRIAQRTVGALPIRARGAGLVPLTADSDHDWLGMIPMADLPRQEDQTFVAAANVPIPTGGHLVSADNAPGYRMRRITDMLASDTIRQAHDMQVLQTDQMNLQAQQLLPVMLGMLDANSQTAHAHALDLLTAWDHLDAAESEAPYLFALWYQYLVEALFKPELSAATFNQLLAQSYLINQAIDGHLLANRVNDWPVTDAVQSSFQRAAAQWQADRQPWGAIHQLTLKHELGSAFPGAALLFNRGPYDTGGGNATVGRARHSHRRPFLVSGGATTRTVLDMSPPIQAWMVAPGGQSGHPLSKWYNDQSTLWVNGQAERLKAPGRGQPDILFTPITKAVPADHPVYALP